MGLVLQPYWTPGIRLPGREAKGTIVGFGDVHTRAHVYRAILEGLAYALCEGKDRIKRRGGVRITELRVSGGGSQSDAAMQLTADIFGLPTARPHVYETSGWRRRSMPRWDWACIRIFQRGRGHDAGRKGVRADSGKSGGLRAVIPGRVSADVPATTADVSRHRPSHGLSTRSLILHGVVRRRVAGPARMRPSYIKTVSIENQGHESIPLIAYLGTAL